MHALPIIIASKPARLAVPATRTDDLATANVLESLNGILAEWSAIRKLTASASSALANTVGKDDNVPSGERNSLTVLDIRESLPMR